MDAMPSSYWYHFFWVQENSSFIKIIKKFRKLITFSMCHSVKNKSARLLLSSTSKNIKFRDFSFYKLHRQSIRLWTYISQSISTIYTSIRFLLLLQSIDLGTSSYCVVSRLCLLIFSVASNWPRKMKIFTFLQGLHALVTDFSIELFHSINFWLEINFLGWQHCVTINDVVSLTWLVIPLILSTIRLILMALAFYTPRMHSKLFFLCEYNF